MLLINDEHNMFFLHRISFVLNYFTEKAAAEKRKREKLVVR